MSLLRHSIEVKTEINKAIQLCLDVENWPIYFEPCKAAKIVKQTAHSQLIEITAQANDQIMTWQSQREIDADTYTIHFQQVKPSVLLKSMTGAWRYYPTQEGVLISLEHQFEVKENVSNLVNGVHTRDDAVSYMKKAIHNNSERELKAIKAILESSHRKIDDLSLEFQESLPISLSPDKVFDFLKNVGRWPRLFSHCKSIDMLYDDGINQEFIMTVETQGKIEKIRSIRRCLKNTRIDYFQPSPPPVLREHEGSWLLEPNGAGTKITSYHRIRLNPTGVYALWGEIPSKEALERIKTAIAKNSSLTMQTIAKL